MIFVIFQVKERCRKGIPPSLRGRAWQEMSGAKKLLLANAGLFDVSNSVCVCVSVCVHLCMPILSPYCLHCGLIAWLG